MPGDKKCLPDEANERKVRAKSSGLNGKGGKLIQLLGSLGGGFPVIARSGGGKKDRPAFVYARGGENHRRMENPLTQTSAGQGKVWNRKLPTVGKRPGLK